MMLREEFPDADFVDLPSHRVRYARGSALLLQMLAQLPRLMRTIRSEHDLLQRFMHEAHVDAIISDNRYGLWSSLAPSVLITHQLRFAGLASLGNRSLHKLIRRFDEAWISDFEDRERSLAGKLSHHDVSIATRFIGPLTRLKADRESAVPFEIIALISGPEPQRSILEEKLIGQLVELNKRSLLLRGLPGKGQVSTIGNLTMLNHLSTDELSKELSSARYIIARCGYSTIMDLVRLKKHALLIPTPGQPEQLYLARYLRQRDWFAVQQQSQLDIERGLKQLDNPIGTFPKPGIASMNVLDEFVQRLQPRVTSSQIGQYSSAIRSL